jgi:hypothetical protein
LDSLLQQSKTNFRLGLIGQLFRNTTSLAIFVVGFCKPLLRQEQSGIQKTVAFPAGVSQIYADLRIGNLAHRAAILPGDPCRMLTLFDHPGFIYQHHPIRFAQSFHYQRLMSLQQAFTRPWALPDEVLQRAHIVPKSQRNPFRHLAWQIAQQTFQINPPVGRLIATLKRRFEDLIVVFQFVNHLLNFFFLQIPFRRRFDFRYNFCGHGNSLLLSTCQCLEKITMSVFIDSFSFSWRNLAL